MPSSQINEFGAFSGHVAGVSPNMNGLVLAGGHSQRMGQPKSLLNYHGKPQYQYVAELLSDFCEQVFISCRAEQQDLFEGYQTICDTEDLGDIGPMNGMLSAFSFQLPESFVPKKSGSASSLPAWFVLGCDYPLLEKSDLEQLFQARNPASVATVFFNPETRFVEPLLGIYEAKAGPLLHEWFQQGNESLRRFLEKHEVQKAIPLRPECLKSVDTPEEFQHIKSKY
ncbi:MAG: NTP transferase domain-containing protein [Phycisphaerae bacterium]|nr:NTP transferase domain-containing protein [Saprospiraceae bacterium]